MKKTLFFAIMAGAALAGCVKNEEVATTGGGSPERIAFDAPVVGVPVRATEIFGNYPTDMDFGVYALYHVGNYPGTESTTYMDNVQCTHQGSGDVDPNSYWAPAEHDYYWPKTKDSKLSFGAYAPSTKSVKWPDGATVAWGEAGFTFTGFKVDDTPADQIDLLYSKRALDKTNEDLKNNDPTYDGIQLMFNHALSSIVFTAKAQSEGTVKLTDITVNNIYSQGNFAQNITFSASGIAGNTGSDAETPAWSNYSGLVGSYDIYTPETETTLSKEGEYIAAEKDATNGKRKSSLIVLPQNLRAEDRTVTAGYAVGEDGAKDATVTITYQIKNGDTWVEQKTVFNLAVKDKADDADSDPTYVWEMGKRYIYNISIGLDKIYFNPRVEPWTDEEGDLI